jgi:hypothetical protein
MMSLTRNQVEAYSRETFNCGNCSRDFEAPVITWVDVSKTPQARLAILKWQFNIVQCTHCGCRHFSGSPFFYEDFEEGLLIAVFPRIPEKRGETEKVIKAKYGYYPVLEFFYDMAQIWMLLYFQEHYKGNANLRGLSNIGTGEERLNRMLRFLKEDALMIDIREKITETFLNDAANEELMDLLGQAVYRLEKMLPWPMDRKCACGADLAQELVCCGKHINLHEHEHLLSKQYVIYCPACKMSLSGASCEECGRVYTWRLGTVPTHQQDMDGAPVTRTNKTREASSEHPTP